MRAAGGQRANAEPRRIDLKSAEVDMAFREVDDRRKSFALELHEPFAVRARIREGDVRAAVRRDDLLDDGGRLEVALSYDDLFRVSGLRLRGVVALGRRCLHGDDGNSRCTQESMEVHGGVEEG